MKELIDKAEVVAEIGKYISNYKGILNKVDKSSDVRLDSTLMLESKIDVLQHILSFLDTLEVKEVDLEKEYDNEFFKDPVFGKLVNRNAGISIAKHFFELGLKTKKGDRE